MTKAGASGRILVGIVLFNVCGAACATNGSADDASRRTAAAACPEPEIITPQERDALRAQSLTFNEGAGYRRVCETPALAPHWVSVPAESVLRVCVHPRGFVYEVTTERSSGDEAFDKMLRIAVRRWRYDPFVRDGKAVAFCHPLHLRFTEIAPSSA